MWSSLAEHTRYGTSCKYRPYRLLDRPRLRILLRADEQAMQSMDSCVLRMKNCVRFWIAGPHILVFRSQQHPVASGIQDVLSRLNQAEEPTWVGSTKQKNQPGSGLHQKNRDPRFARVNNQSPKLPNYQFHGLTNASTSHTGRVRRWRRRRSPHCRR